MRSHTARSCHRLYSVGLCGVVVGRRGQSGLLICGGGPHDLDSGVVSEERRVGLVECRGPLLHDLLGDYMVLELVTQGEGRLLIEDLLLVLGLRELGLFSVCVTLRPREYEVR